MDFRFTTDITSLCDPNIKYAEHTSSVGRISACDYNQERKEGVMSAFAELVNSHWQQLLALPNVLEATPLAVQ